MLEVINLNKHYNNRHVLNDLNLNVVEGEFVSIIGKSGAGKSTLLFQVGLVDPIESGELIIDGERCSKLNRSKQRALRREKISFVLQNYGLVNSLTVDQNIKLAIKIKGGSKIDSDELLKDLEIRDKLNSKPKELSGGEKQRVAIARALLSDGDLILMDEPTGNLDHETSLKFQQLVCELRNKYKFTLILVTHDLEFANRADKCYELTRDGTLSELKGDKEEANIEVRL